MAAIAAGALLLAVLAAGIISNPPLILSVPLGIVAGVLLGLSLWRRSWELPLHIASAVLLAIVAWWTEHRVWWISLGSSLTILGTFWLALLRARQRTREAEVKADQLAVQVDRRISELFSLQELSYVLSESIQLDRVVDQVARYAARFLQADGAVVVLAEEGGQVLRVVAASGSREPPGSHRGRPGGRDTHGGSDWWQDGAVCGRGAAPGPGNHDGRPGSRRPKGRRVHHRGSLAPLNRSDQRVGRACQQPAVRDGSAKRRGVGDGVQRTGRGNCRCG